MCLHQRNDHDLEVRNVGDKHHVSEDNHVEEDNDVLDVVVVQNSLESYFENLTEYFQIILLFDKFHMRSYI